MAKVILKIQIICFMECMTNVIITCYFKHALITELINK